MDIKIEAPGHSNQESLKTFYTDKLNKKYADYPFVKSIDVKVKKQPKGEYEVSLQLKPEKGNLKFAVQTADNEHTALNGAIKKMNIQIEKYKQKHYHTKGQKPNFEEE